MTEREFCYWLQGLLEIGGVRPLEAREVQIIADHLALVFEKVTPDRRDQLRKPVPGIPAIHPFAVSGVFSPPIDNTVRVTC